MPILFGKKAIKKVQNQAKKSAQIPKETMINIMNEHAINYFLMLLNPIVSTYKIQYENTKAKNLC